jgi:transcriptional regulator with PAS, ATPase and Fis domain
LLNEIGEIDIAIQAKLLQVLQDGEFSRLGGEGDISVNTRVITTTKDHLENSMIKGRFREDLFFRINVMSITLPPLRDRREQIPFLSQYFLDFYNAKYERLVPSLSSKTLDAFKDYDWPGNVRELENMIKRIVIFGEEKVALRDLTLNNLDDITRLESFENVSSNSSKDKEAFCLKEVGKKAAEAAEREIIQRTLQKTHWNRKESARLLRVSYKALLYKIQKYGLDDLKEPSRPEEIERCYPWRLAPKN